MTISLDFKVTYSISFSGSQTFITIVMQDALGYFPNGSSDTYELVISSPDNVSTFLTREAAAAYLFSQTSAGVVSDINTVANNIYTVGALIPFSEEINIQFGTKVDKVTGFGLSSNDYTSAEKSKISSLATVATSGAYSDLSGKPSIPSFTAQAHIANAATNAVDINPTNFNLVSGILGVANGLNSANANQNAMADNLNDLATKFNTLNAHLITLGLQA